ncbi:MAG: restriction endonuclease subunit S [archaeon]
MSDSMVLSDFCDISIGLVLKRKEANTNTVNRKSYKVVTLKSFEDSGCINKTHFDVFISNGILPKKYLTQENDVIIRLSKPYTAIRITKELEGYVIPSFFAILRINDNIVDSGYLSFVLNSETTKQMYLKNSLSKTIPVIRVSSLNTTEILVPPLENQKKIAKLSELMIKEKRLHQRLMMEKDTYNKEITKRILQGGHNNAK